SARKRGKRADPASLRAIADWVVATGVVPFGVGSTSQTATGLGDQPPRSLLRFFFNGALQLHCFFYFATFLVGFSRIDLLRLPPAVVARSRESVPSWPKVVRCRRPR